MLTKTNDDLNRPRRDHRPSRVIVERNAESGEGDRRGRHSAHGAIPADDEPYKQAVEARDLTIGKTLDTTDDAARVTVIHSRAGSKKVSVYVLQSAD